MSIQINDNLRISAPKLVDDRTLKEDGTPYSSKAEVLTTIIASRRALGLIVLIGTDFYYFKTGTTSESHLQPLTISGGVQSVTGGIVDNTDPLNPVVIFTPENYDLLQFSNASSNPFVRLLELEGKVDKVTGYGLSQQNYTSAEKTKLSGIENNAQVNSIELIKRNGVTLPIDPADKSVNIVVDGSGDTEAIDVSYDNTSSGLGSENVQDAIDETNERINSLDDIPTKTSDLTNDSGFITINDIPQHNDLTGLQGGTVTERYHLNQAEHEFVQSISPFRNPPTKGAIVFDPSVAPGIVGIGTGASQLVQRDLNGNIKIDVKPFDDEDLADFGTVKEMTKYRVLTVTASNELIEATTPHTLAIVTDVAHNTIRIEPATTENLGYFVKFKVSGISSVLTPEGGSKIVDMDNVPQDDIALSGTVADFISDGSNWQLVTVLR